MKGFFKKNWKWILGVLIVFLCSMVLPFSGDDFDWGSRSVSEFGALLLSTELNGRYVGNFIVILITKNVFIRAAVTALVLVGIVYLVAKETHVSGVYVWLLVLLMPLPIVAQSITWASGFTNYTISTLFLLIILLGIRKMFMGEATNARKVGTVILIFVTLFFVENLTVFLVLMTTVSNIAYFIKNKKVNVALLAACAVSILGTALMFAQPTYNQVFSGEDFYRSFAGSLKDVVVTAVINYVYFIHKYVAFDNVFLLGLVTGASYVYFKKNEKDYSGLQRKVVNCLFYYSWAFLSFAMLSGLNPEWRIIDGSLQFYLNASLSGLYLIAFIIQVVVLFYKSKSFGKLLMPLLCIVTIVAPLFIVTPIGPRNFFVVYILEMIEAFYILEESHIDYKKCDSVACVLVVLMVVYYVSIYAKITIVNLQRDNYIKYMAENTTENQITVPLVPYNDFVHYDDFSDELARPKYNTHKSIRDDMTYVFVPYEEWLEKMQSDGYKVTP